MEIRTIEHDFEYQVKDVFSKMADDYKSDQKDREQNDRDPQSFEDWLWQNREAFGAAMYDQVDEWCGLQSLIEEVPELEL